MRLSTVLRMAPHLDGCGRADAGTTLRRACTKVALDRLQVVNAPRAGRVSYPMSSSCRSGRRLPQGPASRPGLIPRRSRTSWLKGSIDMETQDRAINVERNNHVKIVVAEGR